MFNLYGYPIAEQITKGYGRTPVEVGFDDRCSASTRRPQACSKYLAPAMTYEGGARSYHTGLSIAGVARMEDVIESQATATRPIPGELP